MWNPTTRTILNHLFWIIFWVKSYWKTPKQFSISLANIHLAIVSSKWINKCVYCSPVNSPIGNCCCRNCKHLLCFCHFAVLTVILASCSKQLQSHMNHWKGHTYIQSLWYITRLLLHATHYSLEILTNKRLWIPCCFQYMCMKYIPIDLLFIIDISCLWFLTEFLHY